MTGNYISLTCQKDSNHEEHCILCLKANTTKNTLISTPKGMEKIIEVAKIRSDVSVKISASVGGGCTAERSASVGGGCTAERSASVGGGCTAERSASVGGGCTAERSASTSTNEAALISSGIRSGD